MSIVSQNSASRPARRVLGLIVNPVAGMGGPVGLKGTDGTDILDEARRRGAQPRAATRARDAMLRLQRSPAQISVLAAPAAMGADIAQDAGFETLIAPFEAPSLSTAGHTREAAKWMKEQGADLILFAGGDGTARDIFAEIGDAVPILGIPAGVKMHSAVFATSPANAGHLAARFAEDSVAATLRPAEIMDLDEAAIREDRVSARLFGYAVSPYERLLVQNAKSGSRPGEDAALDAVARQVAAAMLPGCLYILGPGTTTRRVARALDLPSTLLGVDAVLDGRIAGLDLDEAGLLALMDGRESQLIVGILGGQGSLFGRGNQQISASVIRKVGRDRITAIASAEKLIALGNEPLHVDTGDAGIDAMLAGYMRVQTAPGNSTVFKVQP